MAERHFYPEVLGKELHPDVKKFLKLGEGLLEAYLNLHPGINREVLTGLFNYKPQHLFWAGSDLFRVQDATGQNRIVVIETNSCPSGQKSMPALDANAPGFFYRQFITDTILPLLKDPILPRGGLAVLYDKNEMENSGFAAALAEITGESVDLVFFPDEQSHEIKFEKDFLWIKHGEDWRPIRLALRYVTHRPWRRIPLTTATRIVNPVMACLSGGRNKQMAALAYERFNVDFGGAGFRIVTPVTEVNVGRADLMQAVEACRGQAVIKVPYSNAGREVFTITNAADWAHFMARDFIYDQFVVQRLIGHRDWRGHPHERDFFHTGMSPDDQARVFVADVRLIVSATEAGFRPQVMFGRRAREPLVATLTPKQDSWNMLGTNLTKVNHDGEIVTDTSRLIVFNEAGFARMGWSLTDLVEGYFQSLFAAVAIDSLACRMMSPEGLFREHLFEEWSRDNVLLKEILV